MRRIALCLPEGARAVDPDPGETAARAVELVGPSDEPNGVVGVAAGGWDAVELAAGRPDLVDRLVLVSTPALDADPPQVAASVLLLYGSKDPAGGHRQATWWKERLGGRIEMVPGADADLLERVWPRVLSHLAPRARRK